jgi:thioredoxin 1
MSVETSVRRTTDATFDRDVLGAGTPALVEFGAPWCQPCRVVEPVVAELAGQYAGRLAVFSVDADENPRTVARLGVMGLPTLILFAGGREVERLAGAQPRHRIVAAAEAAMAGAR